MNSSSEIRKI